MRTGFAGGIRIGPHGTTFEGAGRGEFAEAVFREFERHELGIDGEVLDYVLTDVLIPDPEWETAVAAGRLDLDQTALILYESLARAKELTLSAGELVIRRSTAVPAFLEIVESRYRCPFGFLIC
jgi:hypothetical protein